MFKYLSVRSRRTDFELIDNFYAMGTVISLLVLYTYYSHLFNLSYKVLIFFVTLSILYKSNIGRLS
jgi:hypothetical protein